MGVVKFGTDGWRGTIAGDFTYANVRVVPLAIPLYVLNREDAAKSICVGWDTCFASQAFSKAVAEVMAQPGIPVTLADRVTPAPALSFAVRQQGTAGRVMIKSCHNPAQWNGVRYKASYGGSGEPSIITKIASHLEQPFQMVKANTAIEQVDLYPPYIAAIQKFVDLEATNASGYKFLLDVMYGARCGIITGIFAKAGISFLELRSEINPSFQGIDPEPILPHVAETQKRVVEEKCDAGIVTDGDADGIAAVDEHGNLVDAHKIFAILPKWLLERKKWPGDVPRAFDTTLMLDRIAKKHGRTLHEHGVRFKHMCDPMLERDILIVGEESGGVGISKHLPERDGILNSVLLAQVMADEKKTLPQLIAALQAEFGEHEYGRIDMHIDEEQSSLPLPARTRRRSARTSSALTRISHDAVIV